MEVRNERWDEDYFLEQFRDVCAWHPSGAAVDMAEAVEYHQAMPPEKNAPRVYAKAAREGRILAQPRGGVATIEGMIELLRCLQDDGESDLVPMTPDTYCRRAQFAEAERGLQESLRTGRSYLNGFPAVIHGVSGTRQVVEAVRVPVSGRTAGVRPQLLDTVMFAGGVTEMVGGALRCSWEALAPAEVYIHNHQYVFRLVGWYAEHGVPISIEIDTHGIGAGTICPPCISIATGVIEALLAAEQGVKHLCVTFPMNNHVIQDLAAIRVQREFCRAYLDRYGHADVKLHQSVNQWVGAYPEDPGRAYAVISLANVIAAYGKADKIMVKSVEEGLGASTAEANAASIRCTKQMVEMMRGQEFPDGDELRGERDLLARESQLILDKVFELGDGDVAAGMPKAFEYGVIELPLALKKYTPGKMLAMRDASGAVRFLDPGNFPFTRDIIELHREKLAERKRSENRDDYEMMIADICGYARRKQ